MNRSLSLASLLCSIVTIWCGLGAPGRSQTFLQGDLNGDGAVTAADVNLLSGYLQGTQSLSDRQIDAADVDRDGQISQQDLNWLQQSTQVAVAAPNSQVRLQSAYSGQVVDQQTGQPLSNVEVAVPGAGVSVQTDSQGRFQLPDNIPANQILVARLQDYVPFSQTTTGGPQTFQVELERLDQSTTLLLESDVVRLGDNAYSAQSAAAGQFQLQAQGAELNRTFSLARIPTQPPRLRIGSLIGLDTVEAYRAGQTRIPGADMSPMKVILNGSTITTIGLAGDNLIIPLPLQHLRTGQNTLTLQTGQTVHSAANLQVPVNIPLFGGNLRLGVPVGRSGATRLDYDDVQLANVVVELP